MPQFMDVNRVGRENSAMEITTGVATDADAVAELHTASWRRAYVTLFPVQYLDGPLLAERQQVWQARLAEPVPGAALFLAMASVLLGFVYLEPQPDGRVLLNNLHARPGDTGRGLGRRLLGHALAWSATAHPGQDVYLQVLQGNTRAVAFYERHGGRRTATRICRFDQGFELPEFEYTWPASVPASTRSPAHR